MLFAWSDDPILPEMILRDIWEGIICEDWPILLAISFICFVILIIRQFVVYDVNYRADPQDLDVCLAVIALPHVLLFLLCSLIAIGILKLKKFFK